MSNAIQIYRHALSGHSHRVELFASLAGISYTLVDVDLLAGEHKGYDFLKLNAFGQVPVIVDGDTILSDSNAILIYLAQRYAPEWYADTPVGAGRVQRFLSMAAGEIAYGPAAARLVTVFGADLDAARAKSIAEWAYERLNDHLERRNWLVGDRPSIADIALYSYTAHAPEGGVSLDPYPNLRNLLHAIEALPGFRPMQATAAGLAS
jgi:glutathione S-transferase